MRNGFLFKSICHTSIRNWVQIARTCIKVDIVENIYNLSAPTTQWEVKKRDSLEAHRPANLKITAANKRPCLKKTEAEA